MPPTLRTPASPDGPPERRGPRAPARPCAPRSSARLPAGRRGPGEGAKAAAASATRADTRQEPLRAQGSNGRTPCRGKRQADHEQWLQRPKRPWGRRRRPWGLWSRQSGRAAHAIRGGFREKGKARKMRFPAVSTVTPRRGLRQKSVARGSPRRPPASRAHKRKRQHRMETSACRAKKGLPRLLTIRFPATPHDAPQCIFR